MEKEKVEGTGVYRGDDEQEDQKMEQFFALIRNFQEARNRRKSELVEKQKSKKIRRSNEEESTWVPTFEWEDFAEEIEFRKPPVFTFPSPCNKKEDKKQQEEDDGLDLKLAL